MQGLQKRPLHHYGQGKLVRIPRFPDFKPVELEDKDYINGYLCNFPSDICELNFGNIFIWRKIENSRWSIINNNLCILCEPAFEPAYFLQPLGEKKIQETIEICLSLAPRFSRVGEDFLLKYGQGFKFDLDRDNFDYIYRAEDLIHLRGKKYDGKRNRIRKFEKSHPYRYLKLSPEYREACWRLFEEWYQVKSSSGWLMDAHREVINESLAYFEDLTLVGGAIEVNGRVVAFTIGERLNETTAVIHIEIASPKYAGLAQLINREFVKNELFRYQFINREQDMGIPGLRRAKLSYHPDHLVKKYNLWK